MRRFISFFWLAFAINIITCLFIYYKIRPSSEVVPLHYNIFYGPDVIGKGYYIYLLPAAGVLIALVNIIFYRYSLKVDAFGGKTLAVVSMIAAVFIFIAVIFLKSLIVV